MTGVQVRVGSASDVGNVRESNQDDLVVLDGRLFAVADGMGGHASGEVASKEAVEALRQAMGDDHSPDGLRQAVRWANRAVWKRGNDEPQHAGMGTTLTAVAVVEGERLAIANVGDSRTYLLRDGRLTQLTMDHSFVQEAVRAGQLSPAQAEHHPRRSQLTRALGIGGDIDVDLDVLEPVTGDRLVLCSDGLWDEVPDALLAQVLAGHDDPQDAAAELVELAKEHGGRDNVTVVVLHVVDGGEAERAVAASRALEEEGEEPTARSTAPGAPALDDDQPTVAPAPVPPVVPSPVPSPPLMRGDDAPTPRPRLLTWRVVAFVVVLVAIIAVAAVAVTRGGPTWQVALDGNTVVLKRGGTVEPQALQVNQLPAARQAELARGVRVKSHQAGVDYVNGLALEAAKQGTLQLPSGGVVESATSTSAGPADSTAATTATTAAVTTAPATTAAPVGP